MRGHNEVYVRLLRQDKNAIAASLAHELTHLIIDQIDKNASLWFHEGMSQYEQEKAFHREVPRSRFLSRDKMVEILSPESFDLRPFIRSHTYTQEPRFFYELSYQIILFIASKGELERFCRSYLQYDTPFIPALKQSVGYALSSWETVTREIISFMRK